MIVEDQLDRRVGRIGGVEKLEEFDEFAAAVTVLDESVNGAGEQIDAGQQADRAAALTGAEFRREFKTYAAAHDLKLNELLRRSFEAYRKHRNQQGD